MLALVRGKPSLDAQVDAIVKAEACLLSNKKAHLNVGMTQIWMKFC